MLKKYWVSLAVLLIFIILSSILFRKYVFQGFVPHPANLLVSFYSPWKYQEWDGYPNGPGNKPIGFDVLKLFYPYRNYTTERLKAGEIPLWNPYVFSGNVHLATYQSAVFYPLNIVYFALPLIDAWSILVVIQPILSGFFTFLFLRSIRLSIRASFWGGAVFAFSGWMIGWSEESLVIEHSALWLPLALLGTELLSTRRYLIGFTVTLLAFVFSILAGFLQMTIYIGIITVFWLMYRYLSSAIKRKEVLYIFMFAVVMSILITAVHLFPAIESYFLSPRGVVKAPFIFETYLMRPWHLITFLVPDFWGNPGSYNYFDHSGFYHEKLIFIGIPAFLLALYLLIQPRFTHNHARFFKWGAIATLSLGFIPFGWILYYLSLPVISAMVPSRIFLLSTFLLCVLSSISIESLLKDKLNTRSMKFVLYSLSVLFVLLWIFVITIKIVDPESNYGLITLRNLVIPTLFFGFCAAIVFLFMNKRLKKNVVYIALLSISLISSLYFGHKYLYFSERRFVFPDVPVITELKKLGGTDRVWGYGNAYVEKNMASFYNLYSPEGYDALYSQRYGELLYTQEKEGKVTNQILRTDATIRAASERDILLENPYRKRLMSLLGVKYIFEAKKGEGKEWLTTEDRFPSEKFSLSWEDESFRIWEYRDALPRVFLATKYRVENDPQRAIDLLFDESFDMQNIIILEKDPGISSCATDKSGTAILEMYEPEKIRIKTESECESLLFLSDNYYPGWMATVDGKEVDILRAHYAFRGVVVPGGNHVVEFTYKPMSFRIGLWTSLLSSLTVLIFLLGLFKGIFVHYFRKFVPFHKGFHFHNLVLF